MDINSILVSDENNRVIFSMGEEGTGILKKGYKVSIVNGDGSKVEFEKRED